MLTHYPFNQLGKANYGWLKTKHHFSFARYYNPKRMGFGALRVINDDWVAPNTGFDPHPHRNMEIITFVRTGAISHKDSLGNKGVTRSGEVQVMSAGSGIIHSEYNRSNEPLTFYQIWIESNQKNVSPRWESKKFPVNFSDKLTLLVSGFAKDKQKALFIYQSAKIWGGKIKKGVEVKHSIEQQAYVLASKGSVMLIQGSKTTILSQGDGAEITQIDKLHIQALTNSEIVLIEVPS